MRKKGQDVGMETETDCVLVVRCHEIGRTTAKMELGRTILVKYRNREYDRENSSTDFDPVFVIFPEKKVYDRVKQYTVSVRIFPIPFFSLWLTS